MNKKGFTLMELLIVVVIIAGMAAITYPSYRSTLERARASEAVNMIGAIQAAQQKHLVNYEEYGETFQDINDFEPSISNFDPTSDSFDSEYFRYTIHASAGEDVKNGVIVERIDKNGNVVDKGYSFIGFYPERFIRCYYTSDEGIKVCSSLTDRDSVEGGSGSYYPIF